MFKFQTYSWSIGTTSARFKEINLKIEEQLQFLNSLQSDGKRFVWREVQDSYYDTIREAGVTVGNAPIKAKDARAKTSFLAEIGLVSKDRVLTEVGKKIIELLDEGDVERNDFMIDADSYIYLKQFLKYQKVDEAYNVRPFVVLLYLLDKLEYLTNEEFFYLVPLCKTDQEAVRMVETLRERRQNKQHYRDTLLQIMHTMRNYRDAYSYFLTEDKITEEVVCNIGMNRKSRTYDKPYFQLYKTLRKIMVKARKNEVDLADLKKVLKKNNSRAMNKWRTLLLGESGSSGMQLRHLNHVRPVDLESPIFEQEFRKWFFDHMHLFKWEANLEEYADLNKRHLSLTDILIFNDDKVYLDLYPKYFFSLCIDEVLLEPKMGVHATKDIPMEEIHSTLAITKDDVAAILKKDGFHATDAASVNHLVLNERERRFEALIDERFQPSKLVELLTWVENRQDDRIQGYVTENAEVFTIFEYIVGIAWYHISERSFRILDALKLSLDANLLPKSHAVGGGADMIINYEEIRELKDHILMIEMTLTKEANQRRAEMEPVPRHLGMLRAQELKKEVYAIFVATHLDQNVMIDFRSRKDVPFYDKATKKMITGNKIIPLNTELLREILANKLNYRELYAIFDNAFHSETNIAEWWGTEINKAIKEQIQNS
jgi:hypothetical protein